MKENNAKKFLLVTSTLSILVLLIGTTFSFFTYDTKSKNNALKVSAAQIRINLGMSKLYTGHVLIPLDDSLIDRAYQNRCVDDIGWGACLAYSLELFNYSKEVEIESIIDFNIKGVKNLSYMVLDEDGNRYLDITHIDSENSTGLTLGEPFTISDGTVEQQSKKFLVLIWLSDTGVIQDKDDAGGSFDAKVTFKTTTGGQLTGYIDGIGSGDEKASITD